MWNKLACFSSVAPRFNSICPCISVENPLEWALLQVRHEFSAFGDQLARLEDKLNESTNGSGDGHDKHRENWLGQSTKLDVTDGVSAGMADALRDDLHTAVTGAVKTVLGRHEGGVVLLSAPNEKGANAVNMLRESVTEQKKANRSLEATMRALTEQVQRLEKQVDASMQQTGSGPPWPSRAGLGLLTGSMAGNSADPAFSSAFAQAAPGSIGRAQPKLLFAVEGAAGQAQVGLISMKLIWIQNQLCYLLKLLVVAGDG